MAVCGVPGRGPGRSKTLQPTEKLARKGRARRWEVLTSAVAARRMPAVLVGRLSGTSQVGGRVILLLTGFRPDASLPDLQALVCTRPISLDSPARLASGLHDLGAG